MQKWIVLCLFIACNIGMNAQTALKGKVYDGAMMGEPLVGASVQVPGSSTGAITDINGDFQFDLPEGKFIVQISMVGYKTQVVNVRDKNFIEVTLEEDQKVMDEVVVVGYGTMK